MNSEKCIGLDVHQATIVVVVMDSTALGFHATFWCVLLWCVESGVFNGRVT